MLHILCVKESFLCTIMNAEMWCVHWCSCSTWLTFDFSHRDELSFPVDLQQSLAAEAKRHQVSVWLCVSVCVWLPTYQTSCAQCSVPNASCFHFKPISDVAPVLQNEAHLCRWDNLITMIFLFSSRWKQKWTEISGMASDLPSVFSVLRWFFHSTQISSAWPPTSPPYLPLPPLPRKGMEG